MLYCLFCNAINALQRKNYIMLICCASSSEAFCTIIMVLSKWKDDKKALATNEVVLHQIMQSRELSQFKQAAGEKINLTKVNFRMKVNSFVEL